MGEVTCRKWKLHSAAVEEFGFGDFAVFDGVEADFAHVHALAGHGAFGVGAVQGHVADELVAVDHGFAAGGGVDLGGGGELFGLFEEGGFAGGDAGAVGHGHGFDVPGVLGVKLFHGLFILAGATEVCETLSDLESRKELGRGSGHFERWFAGGCGCTHAGEDSSRGGEVKQKNGDAARVAFTYL